MPTLNLTDYPVRLAQYVPPPTVIASSGDVTAVQTDLDAAEADIDTLQTDVVAAQADATAARVVTDQFTSLADYANDVDAAAGGVAVGEFYRNGSIVMVRVS